MSEDNDDNFVVVGDKNAHGIDFEKFKKGITLFEETSCDDKTLRKIAITKGNLYMKLPFWGHLVKALKLYPTKDIKHFAADYRHFYFNPEYVKDKNVRSLRGMMLHSIIHLVFRHIQRLEDKDKAFWAMASEYSADLLTDETNKDYNRDKKSAYEAFNIDIRNIQYIDQKYHNNHTEEIYRQLKKDLKDQQPQSGGCDDSSCDGGDGGDGSACTGDGNQPYSCDSEQVSNKYQNKIDKTVDKMEQKRFDGVVKDAYNNTKNKGDIPNNVLKMITEMDVVPVIDWVSQLMKYIQMLIVQDITWAKPSKSMMANNIIFPGALKNNVYVCIAIDTSGSVSDAEYVEFLSETESILNNFGNNIKIVIIDCDAAVQNTTIVEYGEGIDFDLHKIGRKGYGGTRFEPVFEWIEKNVETGEIEQPQLLIYFTDSHGSFPHEEPDYDTVWIYNVEESSATPAPFGEVIYYESEGRKKNPWG